MCEDEHKLRYMQKYAELLVSKDETNISFKSYLTGIYSIVIAFLAIGASYFLAGISNYPFEKMNLIFGNIIIIMLVPTLLLWIRFKMGKKFENATKNIEFLHEIILKIEEKLPDKT